MSGPPPLAKRLERLGTETAYAISGEANALRASGKRIFAFHIGDLNFPTPEPIVEETIKALKAHKTGYCPASGIENLREAIASYVGSKRGVTFTKDEVLVQPGGKPVISKFLLSILEKGDEVLFPTPGYPIYESLINFYEGVRKPYLYHETKDGFALDLKEIESLITPKTKALVVNNAHNPTGAVLSFDDMKKLCELAIRYNLWVLSDEAYFDLEYGRDHADSFVSFPGMKERTVILLTCSKSWSMTGWRLGAAIGPRHLIAAMTKFATNDEACVTQFVQWGALAAFQGKCEQHVVKMRNELQARRDLLVKKIKEVPGFVCHTPPSAFYLFVNVTEAMKLVGVTDLEQFRKLVLHKTGVSVCSRLHFGNKLPNETQDYIRFAYSSASLAEIEEGCNLLKQFMQEARREARL